MRRQAAIDVLLVILSRCEMASSATARLIFHLSALRCPNATALPPPASRISKEREPPATICQSGTMGPFAPDQQQRYKLPKSRTLAAGRASGRMTAVATGAPSQTTTELWVCDCHKAPSPIFLRRLGCALSPNHLITGTAGPSVPGSAPRDP